MSNVVIAKVISQKGTCEAGHRVGDEFMSALKVVIASEREVALI